jgi:hypothetical protein
MNMKSARSVICSLVMALCLMSLSCTGQLFRNYGRIDPDTATTRAFESYAVNPDYRYFISGSEAIPNAILGLHRDQHLDETTLWREVQMTPERMAQLVDFMQRKTRERGALPHGFAITDDKGRQIGVWYSILEARTFVHMEENGTVRIDPPPLNLYEKSEVETAGEQ